ASFILSWIAWITALMMAPIEVQAVLQYSSLYFPSIMHQTTSGAALSITGFIWAGILMFSLCIVNIFSYRGLMRFNFLLFVFKFAVIILTIFAIFHIRFNPANFAGMAASTLTPEGWKSIFSAVATGGIVLAFNGF